MQFIDNCNRNLC